MPEAILARFEARAMGSALRLTVCQGAGDAAAEAVVAAAWSEVMDEFERSEGAMSRFREASELTELNRAAGTGRDVPVGRRLERAVIAADRARRVTVGRFDPRVLAALDRLGYPGAELSMRPAPKVKPAARSPFDGDRVVCRLGPGRLRVDRPIDLGGIGKGLALRWAADRLDRRGLRSYLLEAGGDLVARGRGPDGGEWRIGIEDPAFAETSVAVVAVGDLALTTSSVGVHTWMAEGRLVHHLLDPTTGLPGGEGLLAVTVAGHDPAWAEVWSKTLFLAGRPGIAPMARARGLAAWWISADRGLEMTPAARILTVWVAAES